MADKPIPTETVQPYVPELHPYKPRPIAELKADAARGDAVAQYHLGLHYARGRRIPRDYSLAYSWVRRAAEQGLTAAQCTLSEYLEAGTGTERNVEEAADWLYRAAIQGDVCAMWRLAGAYAGDSHGVERDERLRAYWYGRCLEQREVNAQECLRLAELGDAEAQFLIGSFYDCGSGVDLNKPEAVRWFRLAAEQGHARAQFMLGLCCRIGRGTPMDLDAAEYWLEQSSRRGFPEAAERLRDLRAKRANGQLRQTAHASSSESICRRPRFFVKHKEIPMEWDESEWEDDAGE